MPENMVAFGSTPSSGNLDCRKIIKFFKNKFGDKAKASTHNIVRCHNSFEPIGVEYCKLSKEELQQYSNSVYNTLNTSEDTGDYSLYRKREIYIESIIYGKSIESVEAECQMPFSDGMIVDLKGRVLQCHNHPIQDKCYGTLSNLSEIKALGYNSWRNKERCVKCPVIHGCKGGCPSAR